VTATPCPSRRIRPVIRNVSPSTAVCRGESQPVVNMQRVSRAIPGGTRIAFMKTAFRSSTPSANIRARACTSRERSDLEVIKGTSTPNTPRDERMVNASQDAAMSGACRCERIQHYFTSQNDIFIGLGNSGPYPEPEAGLQGQIEGHSQGPADVFLNYRKQDNAPDHASRFIVGLQRLPSNDPASGILTYGTINMCDAEGFYDNLSPN